MTRDARSAGRVLVVSTGPVVLGNDPGEEEASSFAHVALLGQVQVRVRGPAAGKAPAI